MFVPDAEWVRQGWNSAGVTVHLVAHHSPCLNWLSSSVALDSPRHLVLGEIKMHTEVPVLEVAQEFVACMGLS